MQRLLQGKLIHRGDTYVADYTEKCAEYSDTDGVCKGVVVKDTEPTRGHFKLSNPSACLHAALNLERQPGFSIDRNCEAALICVEDVVRPWALLVELKYCHGADNAYKWQRKVDVNAKKAFWQTIRTMRALAKYNLTKSTHRIYANVHLPWMEDSSPFGNFAVSPEILQRVKNSGINVFTCQTLIAVDAFHLIEP